jgi:hypothetical protein
MTDMLHNKRRKSKGEKPKSNQLVLRLFLQEMMHPRDLLFNAQIAEDCRLAIANCRLF